jgi:hypothetical protein
MEIKMKLHKHDVGNEGAKPRDHTQPPRRFWKHAHRDWRVWGIAVLMIVLILAYVMMDSLALIPGNPVRQPMPEMGAS